MLFKLSSEFPVSSLVALRLVNWSARVLIEIGTVSAMRYLQVAVPAMNSVE